jgi:hypothetical protein
MAENDKFENIENHELEPVEENELEEVAGGKGIIIGDQTIIGGDNNIVKP